MTQPGGRPFGAHERVLRPLDRRRSGAQGRRPVRGLRLPGGWPLASGDQSGPRVTVITSLFEDRHDPFHSFDRFALYSLYSFHSSALRAGPHVGALRVPAPPRCRLRLRHLHHERGRTERQLRPPGSVARLRGQARRHRVRRARPARRPRHRGRALPGTGSPHRDDRPGRPDRATKCAFSSRRPTGPERTPRGTCSGKLPARDAVWVAPLIRLESDVFGTGPVLRYHVTAGMAGDVTIAISRAHEAAAAWLDWADDRAAWAEAHAVAEESPYAYRIGYRDTMTPASTGYGCMAYEPSDDEQDFEDRLRGRVAPDARRPIWGRRAFLLLESAGGQRRGRSVPVGRSGCRPAGTLLLARGLCPDSERHRARAHPRSGPRPMKILSLYTTTARRTPALNPSRATLRSSASLGLLSGLQHAPRLRLPFGRARGRGRRGDPRGVLRARARPRGRRRPREPPTRRWCIDAGLDADEYLAGYDAGCACMSEAVRAEARPRTGCGVRTALGRGRRCAVRVRRGAPKTRSGLAASRPRRERWLDLRGRAQPDASRDDPRQGIPGGLLLRPERRLGLRGPVEARPRQRAPARALGARPERLRALRAPRGRHDGRGRAGVAWRRAARRGAVQARRRGCGRSSRSGSRSTWAGSPGTRRRATRSASTSSSEASGGRVLRSPRRSGAVPRATERPGTEPRRLRLGERTFGSSCRRPSRASRTTSCSGETRAARRTPHWARRGRTAAPRRAALTDGHRMELRRQRTERPRAERAHGRRRCGCGRAALPRARGRGHLARAPSRRRPAGRAHPRLAGAPGGIAERTDERPRGGLNSLPPPPSAAVLTGPRGRARIRRRRRWRCPASRASRHPTTEPMTTQTTTSSPASTTRPTREEKLDAARAVLNAGFDRVEARPRGARGLPRLPRPLPRLLAEQRRPDLVPAPRRRGTAWATARGRRTGGRCGKGRGD